MNSIEVCILCGQPAIGHFLGAPPSRGCFIPYGLCGDCSSCISHKMQELDDALEDCAHPDCPVAGCEIPEE